MTCRPRWAAWLAAAALPLLLGACASTLTPTPPDPARVRHLLHDDAFAPPTRPVREDEVFALDAEMRDYIELAVRPHLRRTTRQHALLDAMRDHAMLRLAYDTSHTRTAREAFDARAGNCLSLVILTAALAEHLSLPVTFQSVEVEDSYSRAEGLVVAAGHVNLVLGDRLMDRSRGFATATELTVDFLPPQDLGRRRVTPISRHRVLAMYFNNRAAETLTQGDTDQAYAYARAAVLQDAGFASALVTLGVVYHRRGLHAPAEASYRQALAAQPGNAQALADLAGLLTAQGRTAEAEPLRQALARLENAPPFHFFELGRAAVQRGDPEAGIAFLRRELARDADYHETHFWLAQAHFALRDLRATQRHLALAVANSTTRGDHDLYAAKLDRLQRRTRQ